MPFATEPNHDGTEFWPYLRDPETLARPWAIPGTPGLMHRIGGIEKQDGTGNVNYDPDNHELMTHLRADEDRRHRERHPAVEVDDDDDAELLVLGWGSTWGPINGGGPAGPRRGHAGGARAPRAPQPVPAEPRRGARPATRRCSSPR